VAEQYYITQAVTEIHVVKIDCLLLKCLSVI